MSRSICGSTFTPSMTVMKFASPDQRGTTCMCRCSPTEPPDARPRLKPTLSACGRDTFFSVRIARCPKAISSVISSSVRSSRFATWRYGTTMRCPALYG